MAELVDALDSESSGRKAVLVRLQSRAPRAQAHQRRQARSIGPLVAILIRDCIRGFGSTALFLLARRHAQTPPCVVRGAAPA